MVRSVTDLDVYNESLFLLKNLYEVLKKSPRAEYDLSINCKRAAKSIPANLAEGFAKRISSPTFKNHLKICIGSSDEVAAHLQTLSITAPFMATDLESLRLRYMTLSKRINSLQKNWKYK